MGHAGGACPGNALAVPALMPLHTLGLPAMPLSAPSPDFLSSAQYWCFAVVTKDLAVLSQSLIRSLWHLLPLGKAFCC